MRGSLWHSHALRCVATATNARIHSQGEKIRSDSEPNARGGPVSGSIREITVFTNGDSGQISTWSNVPYFFIETLKTKGIKVNRVDLNPDRLLGKLWDKTMGRIVRHILKGHTE